MKLGSERPVSVTIPHRIFVSSIENEFLSEILFFPHQQTDCRRVKNVLAFG